TTVEGVEWMNAPIPAEGFLIDLDGTLMSGRTVLPGAAELLTRLGERVVIVSNDAEHTPAQVAARLDAVGLAVPQERIVLAVFIALELIAEEQPPCRVMLVATLGLRSYARNLGPDPTDDRPDVVLLGRDRRFTYRRLTQAANALRA